MSSIMKEIILNASVLVTASLIFNVYIRHAGKNKRFQQVLSGFVIGAIGVALMGTPLYLKTGVFFDTRSVLVSMSGLFFGGITTVISAAIIIIYRIITGGSGAAVGVTVTVISAAFGLVFRLLRFKKLSANKNDFAKSAAELYIFGVITHIAMLLCMFALPNEAAIPTLRAIAVPVMAIYPAAALLVGLIMLGGIANAETAEHLLESEKRFRTMFEQSPLGICLVPFDSKKIYAVNSKYCEIVKRSRETLIGTDWRQITHPDDVQEQEKVFEDMNRSDCGSAVMEKRYLSEEEETIWVRITVTVIDFEQQREKPEKMFLVMVEDITARKLSDEAVAQSELKYRKLYNDFLDKEALFISLIDYAEDLIFYKDCSGVYQGCNKAFEKFFGFSQEQIIGHTDEALFDENESEHFRNTDLEAIKKGSSNLYEETVKCHDGSYITVETVKAPYYNAEGEIKGIIGISRDITERKRKESEIIYLNYHDTLTGLYNRTYFEERLVELDRQENLPLSVIIGDINGLKFYNDTMGHAEGDKLLVIMGGILTFCVTEKDVVARTGGDEFAILLPNTDTKRAEEIASLIKHKSEEHFGSGSNGIYFASISLGYSTKISMDESIFRTIKLAEEYMYRRKLLEYKSLHSSILSSIRSTLYEKSNETEEHAERMAEMARRLGAEIGLDEEQLVELELVSALHDIGKISIDGKILTKTEVLSEDEWFEIKKHPEVGFRISQAVPELRHISEYILAHHERWDGSGYPQGLCGESIPLLSRIISIVDAYDAMTQDRSYRKALTPQQAAAEIEKNSGNQFDPHIAKAFIKLIKKEVDL